MEENQNQVIGSQTSGPGQNPDEALGQSTTINQSQTLPQAQTPQPSQTGPQPQMSQQPEVQTFPPAKDSTKNTLLLIVVLILVVVLMLLIYFSLANRQMKPYSTPPLSQPITAIPTQTDEQELDSIDIGDVDADLKEIDTDLQGL